MDEQVARLEIYLNEIINSLEKPEGADKSSIEAFAIELGKIPGSENVLVEFCKIFGEESDDDPFNDETRQSARGSTEIRLFLQAFKLFKFKLEYKYQPLAVPTQNAVNQLGNQMNQAPLPEQQVSSGKSSSNGGENSKKN